MTSDHDWLTLHRVKFPEVIDGAGKPMPGPDTAAIWRFAPTSLIGPDGLWTYRNDSWGGWASYPSKAEAEAVFNDPAAHLPFLDGAIEAWHALVVPYAHRGGVMWRETVQHDSAIKVAPADPKGPLVVITTAGYATPGPDDEKRIKAFIAGITDVIKYYGTVPGNVRREIFSGGGVDGREGGTITLWRDDMAMMNAAYKSGVHKAQLDRHKSAALFDRSSFTRGRVMSSKGSWDGQNPLDELAN